MISINNMGFRWKLTIPVVLLAFILVVIAFIGLSQISSLGADVKSMGNNLLPSQDYLLQADRDLYQALVAERSLIFLNPDSDEYRDMLQMHEENIEQTRTRVKKFFETSEIAAAREMEKTFWPLFDNWVEVANEIRKQRTEGGRIGRRTAIDLTFNEGDERFNKMRDLIDEMTGMVNSKALAQSEIANEDVAKSQYNVGIALVIGLAVCLIVAIWFPPLITGPLKRILSSVKDLASGEGDLTLRLEVNGNDEIGTLAGSFNLFLDKLHSLISRLAQTTQQVRSSSQGLLELNEKVQDAVDKEHESTSSVASAITQMNATVQSIAQNAVDAASAASQADRDANQGNELVTISSEAISRLAQSVERSAEVINQLEDEATGVGSVLEVITGIAEQTNLLALNAAIEAARAGEHGRGFAVVADEVRTLASRTQQSTTEIQAIIERLQSGARDAVSVMDAGKEHAHHSVEKANETRESLEGITLSVKTISTMNTQIASAAEEQSAVTEDINRHILQISGLLDDTLKLSSEATKNSSELSRDAEQLEKIVNNFKIN